MPDQVQLSPFEQMEQQHGAAPEVAAAAAGPALSPFEQMEQQHNPPASVAAPSADPFEQAAGALTGAAQEHGAEAQNQMNQAFGPESQGKSPLSRASHFALATIPGAAQVVDKVLAGLSDKKSLAVAATGLADPIVPAAYFGYQSGKALWQQGKQAIANPTPDNVQDAALAGAGTALSVAAAGKTGKTGVGKAASKLNEGVTPDTAIRTAYPEQTKSLPKLAVIGTDDMSRAAAPTGANLRFRENSIAAAGDLAEIADEALPKMKAAKGGVRQPDMRANVAVQAIDDHLTKMYQEERLPQIQNNPTAPVSLKVEPTAIEKGMSTADAAKQATADAARQADVSIGVQQLARSGDSATRVIANKARTGTITLAEADQLAQAANKELLGFEKSAAQGQARAMGTRITAGLKELDRHLTKAIDAQLETDGEPGLKSYERRYAALSAYRDQLRLRLNSSEMNIGLKNSKLLHAARAAKSTVFGGVTGIASASQSAVADISIGDFVQRGLERLQKSGIRAERAPKRVPNGPPFALTAPEGQVPGASQPDLNFNGADSTENPPPGQPYNYPPNRNNPYPPRKR